jgi:hypothetical protein
MRPEVTAFAELAPLPSYGAPCPADEIGRIEAALHAISAPVSDEEAQVLLECFGDDDCFGLAWTLIHLIESAPTFTISTPSGDLDHPWKTVLHQRSKNAEVKLRE